MFNAHPESSPDRATVAPTQSPFGPAPHRPRPDALAEAPADFLFPALDLRPAPARPAPPRPTPEIRPPLPQAFRSLPHQLDLPLPADPVADPPDRDLLRRYGAAEALRHNLLPWRRRNGHVLILTASPQDFDRRADFLRALYGPDTRPLPCPLPLIHKALLTHAAADLAEAASRRTPAIASCRSFDRVTVALSCLAGAAALLAAAIAAPALFLSGLLLLSCLSLVALTLLKITAAIAALRHPPTPAPPLADEDLPTISLLIALYGEADIAPRLIRRLSAIDYPRDRLEILILVEAEDSATRDALSRAALPGWMRVLPVPPGHIRTKPRALNFGLDFTRGSIIGIYDAEDAPAADQLRQVAASFAAAPARVACLQGALDFYNPRTNWIARCFTMEYAVWFRLVLPGLARLGLPLPLGGTTLFLRRDVLSALGGWDAHNVTEDADLGLRLARHGWETRLLPSTTLEEANCHPIPWIRQRSRWTKGYLVTWAVHMRNPARLWRDFGPRRFLAVQTLILGSLLQVLLAPLHWAFFLLPPGPDHPLAAILTAPILLAITGFYLVAEACSILLIALALRRAGHPPQWPWLPLTIPYFLMATLAGMKALAEIATRPFHWDKTRHGRHDRDSGA